MDIYTLFGRGRDKAERDRMVDKCQRRNVVHTRSLMLGITCVYSLWGGGGIVIRIMELGSKVEIRDFLLESMIS